MVVRLTPEHLDAIARCGEAAYPEEGCAILLGQGGDTVRQLVEVRPVPNVWSAAEAITALMGDGSDSSRTKTSRYTIDPKDMLKAQRQARERNLDIIGILHSHPDHPAVPSECDRTIAWSHYSYIIVSVQHGVAQDVLSWRLDNNRQFQPEALLVTSLRQVAPPDVYP